MPLRYVDLQCEKGKSWDIFPSMHFLFCKIRNALVVFLSTLPFADFVLALSTLKDVDLKFLFVIRFSCFGPKINNEITKSQNGDFIGQYLQVFVT